MALFPVLSASEDEQVASMITIMLLRAIFEITKDYCHPAVPAEWSGRVVEYAFRGSAARPLTALDICQRMKLNFFPFDHCTNIARRIMLESSKELKSRTINAYLIAVCTSRDFLKAFYESGAHVHKRTMKSKLNSIIQTIGADNLFKCFTRSFNPQRRIRNQLLKLRKAKTHLVKSYFRSLFKCPQPLSLKSGKQAWRPKVDICRTIRGYRGLGIFGAKNFWQFFSLAKTRYPALHDTAFGEVGPGARRGINLLLHLPLDLMVSCTKDASAFFYSDHCSKLGKKCAAHILLRPDSADSPEVAFAKCAVSNEFKTIEGTQFVTCEHSKIVRWCIHGTVIYEYGYWTAYENQDGK